MEKIMKNHTIIQHIYIYIYISYLILSKFKQRIEEKESLFFFQEKKEKKKKTCWSRSNPRLEARLVLALALISDFQTET